MADQYELVHRFKAGNIDRKLMDFVPPQVWYKISFDGKDKDKTNPVLFAEIQHDVWPDLCREAQASIDSKLSDYYQSMTHHLKDKTEAKEIQQTVTVVTAGFNKAVHDYLNNEWPKNIEREITQHIKAWSKKNRKAAKIRFKRSMKVVVSTAKVAKNLLRVLAAGGADAKAWIQFAKSLKKVVEAVADATNGLDKRMKKIVKIMILLKKDVEFIEKEVEGGGFSGKAVKKVAQIQSPLKELKGALEKFNNEITLIDSSRKKAGAQLSKVLKHDKSGLDAKTRNNIEKGLRDVLKNIDDLNVLLDVARGFAASVKSEVLDVEAETLRGLGIGKVVTGTNLAAFKKGVQAAKKMGSSADKIAQLV